MENINNLVSPTVLYISHGGGPMPLLGDKGHLELVENLKNISTLIEKPSAIVVISAHWEENRPSITSGEHPPLLYDYYGFPEASYEIKYPANGEPSLAGAIKTKLNERKMDAKLNDQRGFDHGLFVPLKLMYPQADIPCVQVSLISSLDPGEHIKMGEALGELKQKGLLIIGSGFSFHNMKAFFTSPNRESQHMNTSFEAWLIDTCSNGNISEIERRNRLENWQTAPFARFCHPREEHLLPLHVCYGVANRACTKVFEFQIMGKKASAYLW